MVKIAVTTSRDDPELIDKGLEISHILETPFIYRRKRSLDSLKMVHDINIFLVVEKDRLILKGEQDFFWHPNMAVPRMKALRADKVDNLLEAMDVKSGYQVLDCTLGLASDALVTAYAVGSEGHVTGLEYNKYIAFITEWSLRNYDGRIKRIKELSQRITIINRDYKLFLPEQPDDSFDIVYLDPMFSRGFRNSSAMNVLRPYAYYGYPTYEDIEEALRVARYRVIMKENSNYINELTKLNANQVMGGKYSSISYGVWLKR